MLDKDSGAGWERRKEPREKNHAMRGERAWLTWRARANVGLESCAVAGSEGKARLASR